MNRKIGNGVFAGIVVGLVIFGFYLSQGAIAGQKPLLVGQNFSSHETMGAVSARLAAPHDNLLGAAMGSTINIPPFAFIPNTAASSNMYWVDGYIQGSSDYPDFNAPIIFPKNAKKILHMDFWAKDTSASDGSVLFVVYSRPLGSTAAINPFIYFYSGNNSGNLIHYIVTPAKGTTWSISPTNVYYIGTIINATGYLYGVVVYYQ